MWNNIDGVREYWFRDNDTLNLLKTKHIDHVVDILSPTSLDKYLRHIVLSEYIEQPEVIFNSAINLISIEVVVQM